MKPGKNARLVVILVGVLFTSIGLTAFAVPLYRMFCQQFGTPVPGILVGPTGGAQAGQHGGQGFGRTVTIRFTANVGGGAPMEFQPKDYTLKVKLGEPVLTAYLARNLATEGMDGVAVHMLYGMGGPASTDIAGYIELQQCFCFQSQHYPGRQQVTLPLYFTVSPNLPEGVHTITFAYTLFKALPNDPRVNKDKAGG